MLAPPSGCAPCPRPYAAGQQPDGERQVVDQVPPCQPAWLADQPVDPFQAGALYPGRRPPHRTPGEQDRGSAAYEPCSRQARGQPGDQPLLLGEPEADEDDFRPRGGERVAQPGDVGGRGVEPGGRRVRAGDLDVAVAVGDAAGGELCGAGPAAGSGQPADHVDRPGTGRGGLRQREDEVRAGDPLRQRPARQPRGPDQRHPVGHDNRRFGHELAAGRVQAGPAADVDVGGHDRAAEPAPDRIGHLRDQLRPGHDVEVQPADPDPVAHVVSPAHCQIPCPRACSVRSTRSPETAPEATATANGILRSRQLRRTARPAHRSDSARRPRQA